MKSIKYTREEFMYLYFDKNLSITEISIQYKISYCRAWKILQSFGLLDLKKMFNSTTRRCKFCGDTKDLTEFSVVNSVGNRRHVCKDCKASYLRGHRLNKKQLKERNKITDNTIETNTGR